MQADKIPDEIMREARSLLSEIIKPTYVRSDAADFVVRALMARDKRAAEIAQDEQHRREGLYAENAASINAHRAVAAEAIAAAILTTEAAMNSADLSRDLLHLDTIRELRAQVKAFEAWKAEAMVVLRPFAREAEHWAGYPDNEPLTEGWAGGPSSELHVSDLNAARRLVEKEDGRG